MNGLSGLGALDITGQVMLASLHYLSDMPPVLGAERFACLIYRQEFKLLLKLRNHNTPVDPSYHPTLDGRGLIV